MMTKRTHWITALALWLVLLAASSFVFDDGDRAYGQTRVDRPTTSRPERPPVNQAPVQTEPLPEMQIPPEATEQANEHMQGNYGEMQRLPVGGQIQRAWDRATESAAVYTYQYCRNCVYKMTVREQMTSVIELPSSVVISSFDVGDSKAFSVVQRSAQLLAIQPAMGGIDTSLIVYTREGTALPFYIRAHGIHSQTIPDLKLFIAGVDLAERPLGPSKNGAKNEAKGGASFAASVSASGGKALELPSLPRGEMAPKSPQGANDESNDELDLKVHLRQITWAGYTLSGDEALLPEKVYNDGKFTFLVYGESWEGREQPGGYVIKNDIDMLVNTRVVGAVIVIEAVDEFMSFKYGEDYICIHYDKEEANG